MVVDQILVEDSWCYALNRGSAKQCFFFLKGIIRGQSCQLLFNAVMVSLVQALKMGVSENSVPLNPMVNDHYPY